MKYVTVLTITLLALAAPIAQAGTLCEQKEQNIERQIRHAEQHNNSHRVAGLKKALSEVKEHCTDRKLLEDHQEDIAEQKEKIAERRSELDEARHKGDPSKIAKRERKLAEAEAELKALEKRKY